MTKFLIPQTVLKFRHAFFAKSALNMKRPVCSIKLKKIPMQKSENSK